MGSSSKFDLEVCRNLGFVCACSGNLNDLSALFVLLEHISQTAGIEVKKEAQHKAT